MPTEVTPQGFIDVTEPQHLEAVEGVSNFQEEPWLWFTELYLTSKYQPDFVEATVFKMRSAALERAKIVKEHHTVIEDISDLQRMIESDLATHAQWSPPSSLRKGSNMRMAPRPSAGRNFEQRTLE
jgi:hypothetical protein